MRRLVRAPLVVLLAVAAARAQSDEPAPALRASALLDATQMKGPHHTVAEAVQTPGFYHVFTITSPYGTFEANGRSQVPVRIKEIEAIAALKDVNEGAVVAKAAGESVVNVGKGVASAVTDPEATAKGIGSGVKKMGVNIGRRTQRAVDGATSDAPKPEGESGAGNAAASAGKSVVGINGAMRKWAKQVGVDPYTTNPGTEGRARAHRDARRRRRHRRQGRSANSRGGGRHRRGRRSRVGRRPGAGAQDQRAAGARDRRQPGRAPRRSS